MDGYLLLSVVLQNQHARQQICSTIAAAATSGQYPPPVERRRIDPKQSPAGGAEVERSTATQLLAACTALPPAARRSPSLAEVALRRQDSQCAAL